jgi:hypothetical protein
MTVVLRDTEQCASILVVLNSDFQTFSSMEHFARLKYFTESQPLFLSWQYGKVKKKWININHRLIYLSFLDK